MANEEREKEKRSNSRPTPKTIQLKYETAQPWVAPFGGVAFLRKG
jgi:hypothetical protein